MQNVMKLRMDAFPFKKTRRKQMERIFDTVTNKVITNYKSIDYAIS